MCAFYYIDGSVAMIFIAAFLEIFLRKGKTMRKIWTKALAYMLAVTMCFSAVNVPVYAQGSTVTEVSTETETTNEVVTEETTVLANDAEPTTEEVVNTEEETTDGNDGSTWDQVTTESVFEGENYRVTFTLTSNWNAGYNANVKLENIGDSTIQNWYLGFDYNNSITNIWNAEISSNEDKEYVITNVGWNQDIAAGNSIEFGISGDYAFKGFPENYELIGTITEEGDTLGSETNNTGNEYCYLDENVKVNIDIVEQWNDGYRAEIYINNISSYNIVDWSIRFNSDSMISNSWNCVLEKSDLGYSMSFVEYNLLIKSNEVVEFGFIGSGSCDFNDLVCDYVLQTKEFEGSNNWSNDDITVEYNIVNSWPGGSEVKVRVNNKSDHVIHNWAIRYISDDQFVNVYTAQDMSEGSLHILKNNEWNQDIAVDGYVEFGYTQYYDKKIDIPEDFELLSVSSVVDNDMYSIDFVEESRFGNEGIVNLIIKNKSAEQAIEDWSLEFNANFSIEDIWNAKISFIDTSRITLENADYYQNIAPNSDLFIGMKVSGNENDFVADNYTLKQVKNENELDISLSENSMVGEIIFENDTIEAGCNTATIISAKVIESDDCTVKLFVSKNSEWILVDELFDNGEINKTHDEIQSDGIFTNQVNLYSEEAGDVIYKLSLFKNNVEIDFVEKTIEFYTAYSDDDFENYFSDCETIQNCVEKYYEDNVYEYDKDDLELVDYIKENCQTITAISDIIKCDGNTLVVYFANNLDYYINIVDLSDKNTMPRGSGENNTNTKTIPSKFEVAITGSSSIMYWAPFDSEWADSDETEGIKEIVNESSKVTDFDMYLDSEASVDSLKKMSQAGLVILSTHGVNGEWIVTGEKVTIAKMKEYVKEISTKQITSHTIYDPVSKKSNRYFSVSGKWIENNVNKLPDSIVINNSCYSMCGNLADAFMNKGAKAYFGNNGEVTNEYATAVCLELVTKLVIAGDVTGYAYNTSLDAYYNEGASFEGIGQGNISIATGYGGIGFEDGISVWNVKGDCRVLNKLGYVQPVEGDYMAMISTGVGNTMSGGAISKKINIPSNATQMSFSWNFISAEFLEYIKSQFDDPFYITITCDGTEEKIFVKSVNSVASEFGATKTSAGKLICVSPDIVLNNYGDIWMTDWQSATVDISKYAGKNVIIKFTADNAADTAYPSAMLLDAIHFDSEEYKSREYVDLSNFIRGFSKKNTTGKSYVFWTDEFEKQANDIRTSIQRKNGYKKLEQVVMVNVDTESDFVDGWNSMVPGADEEKIDNVAMVMHGNYFALIINSANKENIVIDQEGLAGSDDNATCVSSLGQKNISALNFYSCNAGLLDAINIQEIRTCTTGDKNGKSFTVEGNVAQAFGKLGGIDTITAYDGSVAFWPVPYNRLPRISQAQNHFFDFLKGLQKYKVVDVKRVNYLVSDDIYYAVEGKNKPYLNEYGVLPNGEVLYNCVNDTATYKYLHEELVLVPVSIEGYYYNVAMNVKVAYTDTINY